MSDSKTDLDQNGEQKMADVTATEGKEMTAVENADISSSADVISEVDSAVKSHISNIEPPSDLEQKIIKQVEVSNNTMNHNHIGLNNYRLF